MCARQVYVISYVDLLFNLGKTEGSIDAGQMIKPALARGLQLVGATTRQSVVPSDALILLTNRLRLLSHNLPPQHSHLLLLRILMHIAFVSVFHSGRVS